MSRRCVTQTGRDRDDEAQPRAQATCGGGTHRAEMMMGVDDVWASVEGHPKKRSHPSGCF